MKKLVIEGGTRIRGSLRVQGAKNSVLPILAAAILGDSPSVIENCPSIRDVESTISILQHLGCRVTREKGRIEVDPSGLSACDIPDRLMREMRSSVIFLGPIIAKLRKARVSFPGGCELGPRPIDLHISSLERLGVRFEEDYGYLNCTVDKLKGTGITLAIPSVGATENIMLAACLAEGVTTITNAAKEPEITDLQDFLNAMGADISGAGGPVIRIRGVKKLNGCVHRIIPDRIVTATYLAAAAVTGGEILLTDTQPQHLSSVLSVLEESGCELVVGQDTIHLKAPERLSSVSPIRTMPYPGFPTDALAPLMTCMSLARGSSIFIETIFHSRYKHAEELIRMGARINVEGRVAVVEGVSKLMGAKLVATDLRGGAALLLAGLAAQGVTEIEEVHLIERGYENIEENFNSLGGSVRRV